MKILLISILLLISTIFGNIFFTRNASSDDFEIKTIDVSKFVTTSGNVTILTIKKGTMSYKVTNREHRNFDFYINANYFDIRDIPVGEVKINNKNITRKNKGGGFFTTDGKNPKFYFGNRPKDVKYSSQTHTPVINKGLINKELINRKWTKSRLPRLILGETKSGDIIVLHTRDNCKLSIYELTFIAQKFGVYNGLMFDGGSSIEVGLKSNYVNYHYQIVSDISRKIFNVPTPKVFIVGSFN